MNTKTILITGGAQGIGRGCVDHFTSKGWDGRRLNGKFLKSDLFPPKEKGYPLWADAKEPTIAKLMSETK